MKILILAGGIGSRLQEETAAKPKPMVEIGGRPMLWHIMKIYSAYGFREFVVALGYRGGIIKDYFRDYHYRDNNLTVQLKTGHVNVHKGKLEDWVIHLVDTGLNTQTGGRIKRASEFIGEKTFMMTYGDGLANIDVNRLLAFHREQGKLATVTAVRPPARFGAMNFSGNQVIEFIEKPQVGEGWVNGGFFILEPGVFDYIEGDESIFEREPLERLAKDGQLAAFKHVGFWQAMDTLRDVRLLEELWQNKRAAWKIWEE